MDFEKSSGAEETIVNDAVKPVIGKSFEQPFLHQQFPASKSPVTTNNRLNTSK